MVIFKSKQKKFRGDLKTKLCGKRLYPTESVKYVGLRISDKWYLKIILYAITIQYPASKY